MEIIIAAVGRAKAGPENDLFSHYARRLKWPLSLREVEEKRLLPVPERVARESALLLATTPPGAIIVALDERGNALTSGAFAARLGRWRDEGVPCVAFLIGGADGHGEAVRTRADFILAFGPQTWPHMLARAMLIEQIYRSQTILEGHPYHRASE